MRPPIESSVLRCCELGGGCGQQAFIITTKARAGDLLVTLECTTCGLYTELQLDPKMTYVADPSRIVCVEDTRRR